jgi:hypothetical protein
MIVCFGFGVFFLISISNCKQYKKILHKNYHYWEENAFIYYLRWKQELVDSIWQISKEIFSGAVLGDTRVYKNE